MGKAENNQLRASSGMPNSLPPKCGKEHRREARYMVSWRAALSVDGQKIHYGRLKDISPHGAAILNDFNIKPGACVTLNIHVPTLDISCESRILTAYGIAAYTVCDAEHQCFRIGISFVEFGQTSDRAYLEERLASCHVKVPDYVCQRSTDRMI